MDFPSPPEVVRAVAERAAHPVYGYASQTEGFFEAYRGWAKARYVVEVPREWLVFSPGVVTGLAIAVNAYSAPGEGLVIQPPVYPPFYQVVQRNGRRVVENRLLHSGGRYTMDLADLESRIDASTRAIILCSPHNPVGRVWTRSELERLASIAVERDLVLISDEIHADIVYAPDRQPCALALPQAVLDRLVCFHAPSKTFNIAGFQTSMAVIPNPALRARFEAEAARLGLNIPNVFGMQAAEAAWRHGGPWLDELMVYLDGNRRLVRDFLASRLPELDLTESGGTYLSWIDFARSGVVPAKGDIRAAGALHDFLVREAGVWCDEGTKFGSGGEGFVRLNYGCTRKLLQQALERIESALRGTAIR
jgi:cystathionine beta-lyase